MASKPLNEKQLKFVQAYLTHGNATQAAKEAGYSGNDNTLKAIGSENLSKPYISAAIKSHQEERKRKFSISEEEIMEALTRIARFDPREVLVWKEGSWCLKPGADLECLKYANFNIYPEYQTKEDKKKKLQRVRLAIQPGDRKGAYELLGKQIGMWSKLDGSTNQTAGSGTDQDTRKNVTKRVSDLLRKFSGGSGSSGMDSGS